MKVNMPEKLYFIQRNGLVSYCRNNDDDIEYIHKDAFIEKAENFLNYKLGDVVNVRVPGTLIPEITTRQDFIECFKKYMEN